MTFYCLNNDNKNTTAIYEAMFRRSTKIDLTFKDPMPTIGINDYYVFRSRSRKICHHVRSCWNKSTDFIFIDTGYFNRPASKFYHRVTLNHYQNNKIIDRPDDRWKMFQQNGIEAKPWKKDGSTIMVCPPTDKTMLSYDITSPEWTDRTMQQLKETHPTKNIVLRPKPPKDERFAGDTLQKSIADNDVFAIASFAGGVAVEAALEGVACYVDPENAAAPVFQTDFTQPLKYPDDNLYQAWLQSVAYDQYSVREMDEGILHNIL